MFPRQTATATFPVEPSENYSPALMDKLLNSSPVIRDTVIIYPASDYPDDDIQDEPFVGRIQILPKEVPESLQFGCKTVFSAGKFQPPEAFSRFPPIAGKPQKIERGQAFSRLVGSHCRDVTRRD
ncbi:hypothetical protein MEG1DRAFT_04054 [Photorhabdus temperata subsp. temperata Meg1]|uniref:Uncharacterized protein n=1 Tax=Photorhabdus temperata subsp. temperata Meg1 TaxID=1393735 RepID=A0A081RRP9_PHOTE|nr:hypothetical protein MEG1DRAFT_04054 [Photorhabdus temperata subsp. temperata Meg1]